MKKVLVTIVCLCFLIVSCQSVEPLPEFSVPLKIADNRPFVEIEINGKTFYFVIDTGGYNSIELEFAKELNLPLNNKFQMPGAGEKTVDAWTTVIDSFAIGGKTFANRQFYVLPLSSIKESLKLPFLDGIIGYDFFRESVLQIDYANKRANFLKDYDGKNGTPFSIYGSHIPRIEVEIDGIKSEFVIDTGDRSNLTLSRHFSEQLLEKSEYELSEDKLTGYGLGGAILARTFDLKSLKFGGIEKHQILTRIPSLKSGVFTQNDFYGSIGSGLLQHHKVTFDYKKRLFYIE